MNKTYHILKYLIVRASAILAVACTLSSTQAYDITKERLTERVFYSTTDLDFSSNDAPGYENNTTPAVTHNGNTYLIRLDVNFRPQVVKITPQETTEVQLEPDDYTIRLDAHHGFTMGIDKDGYIHIVGDNHNFDPIRQPTYLSRFDDANIMYWVSDSPEDISSFSFMGNKTGNPRKIPIYGPSYTKFYTDRLGELYMVCRSNLTDSYTVGAYAVGLYVYDTETQTWTARGGAAPSVAFTPFYPSILWENNGHFNTVTGVEEAYQGFMVTLYFDMYNRMHFAASINNNGAVNGSTDIVYAYSNDGGITFNRADDTPIAGLPMRAEAGPNQASIVAQRPSDDFFWSFAGVYTDGKGNPSVSYFQFKSRECWVNTWDAETQSWGDQYASPVAASNTKVIHLPDANGIMTYMSDLRWGQMTRRLDPTAAPHVIWPMQVTYSGVDQKFLRETGIYRMVGVSQDRTTLSLHDVSLTNKGSFTHELWSGIEGDGLAALSEAPNFPYAPEFQEEVEGSLESFISWGEDYGSRMRGMIHAPTSGEYTFYIAGDDNCEFWLSSDATLEKAKLIAKTTQPGASYDWLATPEQKSATVTLDSANRYYFEVLHKESDGIDHVAVAWAAPNTGIPSLIPATALSPWFGIPEGAYFVGQAENTDNLATQGIGIFGTTNKTDGTPGKVLLTGAINDEDTESFDYSNRTVNLAYAGIVWAKPQDNICKVDLTHYYSHNGGWFDSSDDSGSAPAAPQIQYTTEVDGHWIDVTNLESNYTDVIVLPTPDTCPTGPQPIVNFVFDSINDVHGIRIIGSGTERGTKKNGTPKKERIGIAEIAVYGVAQ
ncbi:BNR-4 repeat-containing protein [Puniceicoccaceae bacterium K14]|nr:BNR-4 repeat-containing protein [Puniceicoccaceae bacterium K14]